MKSFLRNWFFDSVTRWDKDSVTYSWELNINAVICTTYLLLVLFILVTGMSSVIYYNWGIGYPFFW